MRILVATGWIIRIDGIENWVPMGDDGFGELELGLLRCWRLLRDGVHVHVAARQQRLVAALAIRGPCLRSYLVGLLWPEYPEVRALESLRVSVHLMSRQVPGLIVNEGQLLSLDRHVVVDLFRLRAAIEAATNTRTIGNGDLFLLRECRDAVLLPGWFEDWIIFEQNRLQQDRLRALTLLSRKGLAAGDPDTAAAAAKAALEIEPLYEDAVRNLISAELKRGSFAAALRIYERFRERLAHDMALVPSESLQAFIAGALQNQMPTRREA